MNSEQLMIVPFVTQQTDIRVLNSAIGKVVPLVDMARAIGYDRKTLAHLYDRNRDLFEGTSGVMMAPQVNDNRGTMAEQDRSTLCLNSYGVVGLLMKLDYNRIQDADKRANVLRFQRWAMQVLGNAIQKRGKSSAPGLSSNWRKTVVNAPEPPDGLECISTPEAAELLGISRQAVLKQIMAGKLTGYRESHRGGDRWVVPIQEIETATLDNSGRNA